MTLEKAVFSSETDDRAMPKIGAMQKRLLPTALLSAILCLLPASGIAASSPLDFNYRVTGASDLKPLLVFNDGIDTFIQPQDPTEKNVLVNGEAPVRQGPYFVVRGVVTEVSLLQGKNSAVRIAHLRPQVAPRAPDLPAASVPAPGAKASGPLRVVANESPSAPGGDTQKGNRGACLPHRETRESAFVATFKRGTSTLSSAAEGEFKKFVGDTSSVSSVEIIAEGGNNVPAQKRADSIKKLLVDAGISAASISASVRAPSGIGSEVHIKRTTEVPCGAAVVRMPSKKLNATVIWDGDGAALVEKIAQELRLNFSVRGGKRPLPVRMAVTDVSFAEAMQRVGAALGDDVDLVLRSTEVILDFKDTQ